MTLGEETIRMRIRLRSIQEVLHKQEENLRDCLQRYDELHRPMALESVTQALVRVTQACLEISDLLASLDNRHN